jgi:hypothetical protein
MSKLTGKEIDALLDRVTQSVEQLIKSEALSKAEPEESAPEPKEDSSPAPSTPSADSASPAPEPASPDASPAADVAPQGPDAGTDPQQDQQMSPDELKAEYSKLSPDELKMHFEACQAAMMAVMGNSPASPVAATPAPDQSAPTAPPAAPAASPTPAPDMTQKSEKDEELASLRKSLSDLQSKLAETETKYDTQIVGLVKALEGPVLRKSAKSLSDFVAKPGTTKTEDEVQLTKSEILSKLNKAARDPSLAKSDREKINDFVTGRDTTIKTVAHLLK